MDKIDSTVQKFKDKMEAVNSKGAKANGDKQFWNGVSHGMELAAPFVLELLGKLNNSRKLVAELTDELEAKADEPLPFVAMPFE